MEALMRKLYLSKKAMVMILLSLVSVFSFVMVSYSTTVFPPLLPTLSLLQLFSYSSERNYIFLLCNGILVFIIKNSGFIVNSSLLTDHDHIHYYNHQVIQKKTTEIHVHVTLDQSSNQIVLPAMLFIQEEDDEEEEDTDTIQNGILVKTGDVNSLDHGNEVEQPLMQLIDIPEYDDNENCEHEFEQEEEEEEEEEEGTEELNKRCEEFIRRMKENIKTEARATQLVMIH